MVGVDQVHAFFRTVMREEFGAAAGMVSMVPSNVGEWMGRRKEGRGVRLKWRQTRAAIVRWIGSEF